MVVLESAESEVIVIPEEGADDGTIVVQEGREGESVVVCQNKDLIIKQLSYKKALKANQLWCVKTRL